jgi:uncharacterized protein involved in type VI secretion and phage assembly
MSPVAAATGARPVITVGGVELPARVAAALRTTIVDTDAEGPDSCRLVLDDAARVLLQDTSLDLASPLVVTAGRTGEDTVERLFDGVVYAIGLEYDGRGSYTTVTAYDRSYGLYTGVRTSSYQDVTDSDLASTIARRAGLRVGQITPTTVVHRHVAQVNETDIEFLTRRGRETGRVVVVRGDELSFTELRSASDGPEPGDYDSRDRLQLVPGGNLQRLSVRITAAQQVGEVEVRGWDPGAKDAVVATSAAGSRSVDLGDTPASLADLFGRPRLVSVEMPLDQQAECEAVARAQADHVGGGSVHAEGTALGDPRLVAGAAVSVGQTGGRFDGKVTLTRARHIWDDHGYRTLFTASGAHDRSLLGLLARSAPARASGGAVVVGVVTNVADPESLGRVRLRFPWLDDAYETGWVRVLQLGAGADRGLQLLPEVQDEVLVAFEHGDVRRPYVLGGLYNGVDNPPHADAVDQGGAVVRRVWRSRTGHEITLNDESGAEAISLTTGGAEVSVVLSAADGTLTISTEGDVSVEAKGAAQVSSQGDLTITTQGSGTIKASSGLTIESQGQVAIKGATIALN